MDIQNTSNFVWDNPRSQKGNSMHCATLLQTFGGLKLLHSNFLRPKPLLLLTYLVLEGPQDRRFLAELFWLGAANHLNSLAKALSQLRKVSPSLIEVNATHVRPVVEADITKFLAKLDKGQLKEAIELYQGPFLEGFHLKDLSFELEEWIYSTREFIATMMQTALLSLAECNATKGNNDKAFQYAETAFTLAATPPLEPSMLKRVHRLLLLGDSPYLSRVQAEAEDYGLTLNHIDKVKVDFQVTAKLTIPNNLPIRGTAFIGREQEIKELGELLLNDSCRLVTLLGQGGIGKTRLALQVAYQQLAQDRFKDGVYFVELDSLKNVSNIPSKIAEVLQFRLQGNSSPEAQVQHYLSSKEMLLILDNYEHLLKKVILVSSLLSACPHLNIIVTSRERLNLEGEWLFNLDGLLYPSSESASLELTRGFDAIQLFVERAVRSNRTFKLTENTWQTTAEICYLVEGLPLALELAATWLSAISLNEVAKELKSNLGGLSTSIQDIPDRHQSILATFEHSWKLLTTKEQEVLRKLSVFRGGFRREAAAKIVGATLPNLASLINKSLLRVSNEGWYTFHPLIYECARNKLATFPNELTRTREKHGLHYHSYLQRFGKLPGVKRQAMLKNIDEERENTLAAWCWLMDAGSIRKIEQVVETLVWYFEIKGHLLEGTRYLDDAISKIDKHKEGHKQALGYLLVHFAWLIHWSENERAVEAAQQGLCLLQTLDEHYGIMLALRVLGLIAWRQGDYREAERYLRKALCLVGKSTKPEMQAVILDALGLVLTSLGSYDEAQQCHRKALMINKQIPDPFQHVHNLAHLSAAMRSGGDLKAALVFAQQALELARETDFEQYLPICLSGLGWTKLGLGMLTEAKELALEALQRAQKLGESFSQVKSLVLLGLIASELDQLEEAQIYLQDGINKAWSLKDLMVVLQALSAAAQLAWRQGKLLQAAKWASLVKYHPASLAYDIAEANVLLDLLHKHLPKEIVHQAQKQGKTMRLEEAVANYLIVAPVNHETKVNTISNSLSEKL